MVAVPNIMLSWQGGAELSAAIGLAWVGLRAVGMRAVGMRTAGPRRADRAQRAGSTQTTGSAPRTGGERARAAAAFAGEAFVVAVLYTVWQLAGQLSVMGTSDALSRGRWIDRFEHGLHLPSEASVQRLVLGHPWLVQGANGYYAVMHFGALFIFLLWLYFRHRDRYSAVRTTLAVATLGCLVIALVPVAPPRLLDGFVDTAVLYNQSVYGGAVGVAGADQLSAMPSVHVLWAVAIGWYAWSIARGRWRWIGPAHAAITVFVVVATGNHWWLDGIVAVAVLLVSAGLYHGTARAWRLLQTRARTAERRSLLGGDEGGAPGGVAAGDAVAAGDVVAAGARGEGGAPVEGGQ